MRQAFHIHQPLRNLFWLDYSNKPDDRAAMPEPSALARLKTLFGLSSGTHGKAVDDKNPMSSFWAQCALSLAGPKKIMVHDWTVRMTDNGPVWRKHEREGLGPALYTAWTGAAGDRAHKSGPVPFWHQYVDRLAAEPYEIKRMPTALRHNKSLMEAVFIKNCSIGRTLETALVDNEAFIRRLALHNAHGAANCASARLCDKADFMLDMIALGDERCVWLASQRLKADKEFLIQATAINPDIPKALDLDYYEQVSLPDIGTGRVPQSQAVRPVL